MSVDRHILFGAVASWGSRGITLILGLMLMPVLFRHLSKEELGVWLLLGQTWGAMGVLDLGFGVTLTRQIAFAKGKSGADPDVKLSEASLKEIADLVTTGRRIYKILSVISFILAFGLGSIYTASLDLTEYPDHKVWIAWGMMCLSYALSTWAAPWACLLQGVGQVGWDSLLFSTVNAVILLAQISAVLFGGGLISLALAAMAGALLQRYVFLMFSRWKRPELFRLKGCWRADLWKRMRPIALRVWLTALGGAVILNSDHLFVAKMDGASGLPAYRAAYVIFLHLNVMAVTAAAASSVFISHLWQDKKILDIQRIVFRNSKLGLFVMAAGGGAILGLGSLFFDWWLGVGNFIGNKTILVFFILLILEAQSYIITTASRATEDEAFVICTLTSAALKLTLSALFGSWLGLTGIALGTLVAQMLTSHWFMVWRGLCRLQIDLVSYLKTVAAPAAGIFLISLGGACLMAECFGDASVLAAVSGAAIISGISLLAGLWLGLAKLSFKPFVTSQV